VKSLYQGSDVCMIIWQSPQSKYCKQAYGWPRTILVAMNDFFGSLVRMLLGEVRALSTYYGHKTEISVLSS
jgi:hypothetical protein